MIDRDRVRADIRAMLRALPGVDRVEVGFLSTGHHVLVIIFGGEYDMRVRLGVPIESSHAVIERRIADVLHAQIAGLRGVDVRVVLTYGTRELHLDDIYVPFIRSVRYLDEGERLEATFQHAMSRILQAYLLDIKRAYPTATMLPHGDDALER